MADGKPGRPRKIVVDAGTTGGTDSGNGVDAGVDGDDDTIDPRTVTGNDDSPVLGLNKDGSPRRRRGRKPGGTTQKASSLDLNGLEAILLSTHMMLAAIVKEPVIAIDKAEAALLATSIGNVARHYDLGASRLTLDWIALGSAMASVYAPRAIAMWVSGSKKHVAPTLAVDNA